MRPSVLIIYTGGTIGMIEDPATGMLQSVEFPLLQKHVPELSRFNLDIDWATFKNPIDSSNADIDTWVNIAKIIESNYYSFDGFVVLHGTDTMAYSASALSFMFRNLDKPIIFTGSQLPIGRLRTDGKENLITAIEMAAANNGDRPTINEVCILFESELYRGNRTHKYNTEDFDAFQSANYSTLANSGVHIHYHHEKFLERSQEEVAINIAMDNNLASITLFPGMNPRNFEAVCEIPDLKALIIETFGSGNAPTAEWFFRPLEKLVDKGVILINLTQCNKGFVEQGVYATSERLMELGAWSAGDMTFEATITKTMHILAVNGSVNKMEEDFHRSLAGERTTHSELV